jgi:hypothetical protein
LRSGNTIFEYGYPVALEALSLGVEIATRTTAIKCMDGARNRNNVTGSNNNLFYQIIACG